MIDHIIQVIQADFWYILGYGIFWAIPIILILPVIVVLGIKYIDWLIRVLLK